MTNEELLERIANGEEAALTKLCLVNTGLVKDRARLIARQYHCLRQTKYGGLSDYAKETLSELESVGKLALVECVRAGNYDAERGRFTTYTTPSAEYLSEFQKIIQNICCFPEIFRRCFIGLVFTFSGSMGQVWRIVLPGHCCPEVAQHLRNLFCVHSVLQGQDGTGVP